MRTPAVLLSALTLLSSAYAAPVTETSALDLVERQVPVLPCSNSGVHVIASGGSGLENTGKYGRLGTLARNITSQIPGSTAVQLPYNKAAHDHQGLAHINDGAHLLHQYIYDYHTHCPNTKIVLIGYSAGAIMTMNTLCGASKPFSTPPGPIGSGPYPGLPSKIIAAVVYGDQTRVPGPGYNFGTGAQQCHGRWPRTNTASCVPSFPYQSYCDIGDPECCAPGTSGQIHFVYPDKYDAVATQFVMQQFHK